MLGEYQEHLIHLDLFTPNEIACLVYNLNPYDDSSKSSLQYIQVMKMIETSIKAGKLEVFNDDGLIEADKVKRYLADKNIKIERFNKGLMNIDEPVFLDEVTSAVYKSVNDSNFSSLAARLGVPPNILRNKINPTYASEELTLTEAIHIMELTNDFSILQAIISRLSLNQELSTNNSPLNNQLNSAQAEIESLKAENCILKEQLERQPTHALTSGANNNLFFDFDWQPIDEYKYPPELNLALIIWNKAYLTDDIKNAHITDHSAKFDLIASRIGLNKNTHGGALIDRLKKITTPQIKKQGADIEKLRTIEGLNIKGGNPQE